MRRKNKTAIADDRFFRAKSLRSRQSVNLSIERECAYIYIYIIVGPTPTPIDIGSLSEKGPAIDETRGLLRGLEII